MRTSLYFYIAAEVSSVLCEEDKGMGREDTALPIGQNLRVCSLPFSDLHTTPSGLPPPPSIQSAHVPMRF